MSEHLSNLRKPIKVLIDTEDFGPSTETEMSLGGRKTTCQSRDPEGKEISLLQKEDSGHSKPKDSSKG